MVVLLKKKAAVPPAVAPAAAPATPTQKTAVATAAHVAANPGHAAKPGGFKFLKRGQEAQRIMNEEEAKAAVRQQMRENTVRRYWMPAGGTGDITFLDGNLKDGVLDIPYAYEHNVLMNGHRRNWFLCTQEEEPCPICEAASSGGERAQYVGYLTIINHKPWKDKKGVTHQDVVELFAAKKDTVKLLQTLAVKRGGLRGCRFDVARVGDKSASVGSAFDFTEKLTEAQLKQKYGKVKVGDKFVDISQPINYENYTQMLYQPAQQLRELGFGTLGGPIGSEKGAGGGDSEGGDAGDGYDV
jgi:hypothetical protein